MKNTVKYSAFQLKREPKVNPFKVYMNLGEAKKIAGSLGKPSKMPGKSYGIPARHCKIGGILRDIEGSVCHGCYAFKGNYTYNSMQKGLQKRFDGLSHPKWVEAMALQINHYCKAEPWFRWHDSGDLQSLDHLSKIVMVCMLTPTINHWLPTREIGIVQDYFNLGLKLPENLTVRISASMVGGKPTLGELAGKPGITTSTVHEKGDSVVQVDHGKSVECRSYTRDNKCGSCRACWSPKVANVSYKKH